MLEPVRRSVRVKAPVEHAFQVFTTEMDSWWPRSHHIGGSPMSRVVVEPRQGGAIYTEQEDGTNCPWASVLVWEPPHRFVMAWQVDPSWIYQPDLAKSSEVEVTFTPADDGSTLVELEHRHFERHLGDVADMHDKVGRPGGWVQLLEVFAQKANN